MKEDKKEEKTVYTLELHESLSFKNNIGGNVEVTRVPGGWVYAFEFPGFRQSPIVFVPFNNSYHPELLVNHPDKVPSPVKSKK